MSQQVVDGAELMCSFGISSAVLTVPPVGRPMVERRAAACVNDCTLENIVGFGACRSPANPTVAAGSPTGPCLPAIVGAWQPGMPVVKLGNSIALTGESQCVCDLGGVVTVLQAGTTQTRLP